MTTREIEERLDGVARMFSDGGCPVRAVRFGDARDVAEEIRADMQIEIDKLVLQLAEKEAKIYAYEAIIANSNFKAVLPRTKGGES